MSKRAPRTLIALGVLTRRGGYPGDGQRGK